MANMDSSQSSLEPVNIFSEWYPKLCHIMKRSPIPALKPLKIGDLLTLKFVGDEFGVDEWILIAHALSSDKSLQVLSIKSELIDCSFLHDADSEQKVRSIQREFGWLWTAYIFKLLTISISFAIRQTEALTRLELDGLPMFPQYLEDLLKALGKNRTIIHLSLANCIIGDAGCETVCKQIRGTPNIEILNLSGCHLSSKSGEYLADLMQYQRFKRYSGEREWSLARRIESSRKYDMRGVKRITINDNAIFGDEGFEYLLNELKNNSWIKALDLRRCGITEELTPIIINILCSQKSLEIVDLRLNDCMNQKTIKRVQELLQQDIECRQEFDDSSNLTLDSTDDSKFFVINIVTHLIQFFIFCYDKLMNH
ncbi:centrosomal protein of 78 kDa-like [Diorhabda sublineata]|uniref:centrosomal protein of 78 kDa-like n=1 Tax=Diorhabda sublineata TaxID=1163346 RepID=UPI0024E15D9D|nr:centrosomal protein of 78 kDa-like [Diorhabda sublineata]